MKTIDFMRLVQEMRRTQQEYFKTRSIDLLKKSKNLEMQVDDIVFRSLAGRGN